MLRPVYDALVERNRQSAFHQADETRWLVFVETAGKTGFRWWLWVFADGQTVVYRLDPSRSRHVPQGHLGKDIRGVLLVDRYSAYKAMDAVKSGSLLLAFCWAHVRRDFLEVGKGYPELAEFNEAEQDLRPAVEEMQGDFTAELADEKLRQPCRKVLKSLRNHWEGLTLFVDRPEIPLDNNKAERLMRGPALGRKNYCGSGSKWSGRLAETMFSIVATMACWNLNARTWLAWYLEACAAAGGRAPSDIAPFLPWNFSAERRAALAEEPAASRPTLADTS